MHISSLFTVAFTFLLLFGTSLAIEACGTPRVTFTDLTIPPAEATAPRFQPTDLVIKPSTLIEKPGGLCPWSREKCTHKWVSDSGSKVPPHNSTTQVIQVTESAPSVSTSGTSSPNVPSSTLTTFPTSWSSSASISMVPATSTSSATTTVTEVTTPILTETPTISTTSESKASTTQEPVATIEGFPYQGTYHEKVLYSHNIHRGNHSAPNLNWDQRLSNAAHDWAIQCQFHHNTGMLPGGYGQNLAGSSPSARISQHISDFWYNGEMRNFDSYYDQSNPGEDFGGYGHFTQVVWKDTRSVGCATIDCRDSSLGMWYTVCNYHPPGNYLGLFDRNVMRSNGWETERGSTTDLIDRNSW